MLESRWLPGKFEELITADDRSLRFTSLGLATGGKLSPENAAEFQQRSSFIGDLATTVPKDTRDSFERLRTLHSYGALCYDPFTVAEDLRWVVLEQALREKFIEYYEGALDITGWAERVQLVNASSAGPWELPVLGQVSAPSAVLVRPDGHVAWVGEGSDAGLRDALTTWFGPAASGARTVKPVTVEDL